jgi:hypothetical protein
MGCKFSILLLESHPTNASDGAASLKSIACNFVLGNFAIFFVSCNLNNGENDEHCRPWQKYFQCKSQTTKKTLTTHKTTIILTNERLRSHVRKVLPFSTLK